MNFVVPVTGLEPVQYRYREILSLLCLPFHHTGSLSAMIRIPHMRRSVNPYLKKHFVLCKKYFAGRPPSEFAQLFPAGSIYWVETRKGGVPMLNQNITTGDVDDLIFQDCWWVSER